MAQLVLFLLAFLGVFLFLFRKYVPFLLVSTFIAFDGFGVIGDNIGRTGLDAFTLMTIGILAIQKYYLKAEILNNGNNRIARAIKWLLLYILLRTIVSILLSEESLVYSFKVFRTELFILSYFVFIQIDNQNFYNFFSNLLEIICVVGAIYLISFLFWLNSGLSSEMINYTAMLALSAPLLFFAIFDFQDERFKLAYIIMYSVFLLSTFSRGVLLATGVAFGYYFYKIRNAKRVFLPMLLLLPLFYLLFSVVDKSKSENVSDLSTVEEISNALTLDSYDEFEFGSFGLRFALVWERIDYAIENPKVILFGIGSIHEDSPNNKFDFMVGSHKTQNGERSVQMIDSNDVAFLSHWFRYGIVWLFLFVYFLKVSFSELNKRLEYPFVITATLTLVVICVASFSNDFFSELAMIFVPLLLLSRINQVQPEDEIPVIEIPEVDIPDVEIAED